MENGTDFNWEGAIDRNLDALVSVLRQLFALAGVSWARPVVDTLPRYLRFRILAILRPAEFAARRLLAMAACKLDLDVGPIRVGGSIAPSSPPGRGDEKSAALRKPAESGEGAGSDPASVKIPPFALFDPFKPFGEPWLTEEEIAALGTPVMSDSFAPYISSGEPVDARALCLRIAALRNALADFDGHALRLARWRARRAAGSGRPVRLTPFRPGRPPGWVKNPKTEIEELLQEVHFLGLDAWTVPNTS